MQSLIRFLALATFAIFLPSNLLADDPPKGGFTGISIVGQNFSASTTPTPSRHLRVLCFNVIRLVNSGAQPFVLVSSPGLTLPTGLTCSTVNKDNPLVADDVIVLAVQALQTEWTRNIELLNLNVVSTAVSAQNPAPTRTSEDPTGGGRALVKPFPPPAGGPSAIVFIQWPTPLKGDTSNELVVKMLFATNANIGVFGDSCTPPPPKPPPNPCNQIPELAEGESTISLLDVTLPPVHSLSHYNLATGVVASTLHAPSFNRVQTGVASGTSGQPGYVPAQYKTVTDPGAPEVMPVLLFTIYIPPMDAERKWRAKDLIPQPLFGFSLSSPSTDFFFGGAVEPLRNIQIVGGAHAGKITQLITGGIDDPTSSAAPATSQQFKVGGFVGVTFNINFIKGLFGKS